MSLADRLNERIELHSSGFKNKSYSSQDAMIQGVFIPIEIDLSEEVDHKGKLLGAGKMRAYLQFPGEFGEDYDLFMTLVKWVNERYEIPSFKKKQYHHNGFKKKFNYNKRY